MNMNMHVNMNMNRRLGELALQFKLPATGKLCFVFVYALRAMRACVRACVRAAAAAAAAVCVCVCVCVWRAGSC